MAYLEAQVADAFRKTTTAGGYGSLLSQGRRQVDARRPTNSPHSKSVKQPHPHTPAFPRHDLPELCFSHHPRKEEGAGNAGCTMHPQPRVGNEKTTRAKSPQVRRNKPAFPARLVLTVSFVLSLVTGLFCHHHLAIPPRSLTPASGCQDHTPSPSARHVIRLLTWPASIAPRLTFRDDSAYAPLAEAGRAGRCR